MMKRSPVLALVLVSALMAACGRPAGPVLQTLDGREIVVGQQEDKVLFINFWAEWCAPCRDEIPELNDLLAEYGDRLWVLGVNADGVSGEELEAQIERMGIEFPSLPSDPRPIWELRPSGALPETLVVTADGELHQVLLGAQTEADLLAVLEEL